MSTNPLTPDLSVAVLVLTVISVAIGLLVSPVVGNGDGESNLMLTPLNASEMSLVLDVAGIPSMLYLASFGVSTTVEPTSRPELPDNVRSDPTPMVVDVSIRREPLESVRTLALKPAVAN